MYITTFPAILRSTSPTPIGRSPGFLLSGIKRFAVNASKLFSLPVFSRCMFVVHKLFTNSAKDFRRPNELDPNCFEANIQRQLSASNPEGPHPPFVFITAFNTNDSLMSSYTIL